MFLRQALLACIGLQIGDFEEDIRQAIARKIIEVAKTGERNPDLLCERALKDIRRPQLVSEKEWQLPSFKLGPF
jgi:hypothetical protein